MCDVPDEQHQGSERYLAARELDLHQLVDSRHESDGSKADRSLFDHLDGSSDGYPRKGGLSL